MNTKRKQADAHGAAVHGIRYGGQPVLSGTRPHGHKMQMHDDAQMPVHGTRAPHRAKGTVGGAKAEFYLPVC